MHTPPQREHGVWVALALLSALLLVLLLLPLHPSNSPAPLSPAPRPPVPPVTLTGSWSSKAALPEPRTEVAGVVLNGQIAIAGGMLLNERPSARVDLYSPQDDRWRRLPDLPLALHHPAAASWGGQMYVVGGYHDLWEPERRAFVFEEGRWRELPRPPAERAAAGAAVINRQLYVVGGVDVRGPVTDTLVFDLASERWSTIPGPTPREHLAVTAAGGEVYAIAGRTIADGNLAVVESLTSDGWRARAPLPYPTGGVAAAASAGHLIVAGGEENKGTVPFVFVYELQSASWRRAPDLPLPRHGLAVVAVEDVVYIIGGGPEPGLFVSGANEALDLKR